MATLASTQVVYDRYSPATEGPFTIEYWKVASGGASGDTVAITPTTGRLVVGASGGPFSHDASTNGSTNVTLTLRIGTNTIGSFDVRLLCKP